MKNAFLSIKFHEDCGNKRLIEDICKELEKAGIKVRTIIKDYEKWGKVKFEPDKLMKITFEEIDKTDMLIVEFSEKGVGLGIESGYAYSKNKPIIVLAKEGSDISTTLKGISTNVILYKDINEISSRILL
jgi:2'-deoxynucleoside 5'-phosphate N-hydrolase